MQVGEEGGPDNTLVQYDKITPEDEDVIKRLMSLDFEREKVVSAYLACDKNENTTAEFLLQGVDDE
ncbi:hypothetical protein COEREDRAFT_82033 [Coemansia reversa NRRL 1564]|uniref:UV excision repair protein RAD23 n=1 Tax=Coemansia reversa (strain ATCC 12441 / NRRL 1564) TaxID=763665 RepID=A0A2G5B935_COERN|nr:hypothetical protein COEREDRAFT_82033 [Coemansia reversa NRRL 1564]|eukprot:PIA15492.1 hypothetical protein COEREDRAFT_82033 [Coemansia reversa NRRL 1564]